jgi:large subunit ribosomal protein L6
MSRLIKKSIPIEAGVTVNQQGAVFHVKGPKGENTVKIIEGATVRVEGTAIWVTGSGTVWSLIKNAIEGVTKGFTKTLEIEGVGYRAVLEGKELVLYLGYALPVRMPILPGIAIVVEKSTIKVSGIDKDLVGRASADIRSLKKPEPYKGKGIHYQGEVIRRKVGKKAGATGAAA